MSAIALEPWSLWERNRVIANDTFCSSCLPRGTQNPDAKKTQKLWKGHTKCLQKAPLKRTPFSARCMKRKNVIRLRRRERIELPGVPENCTNAQEKRVPRPSWRVCFVFFPKSDQTCIKKVLPFPAVNVPFSNCFALWTQGAPQDFQMVAQSFQKSIKRKPQSSVKTKSKTFSKCQKTKRRNPNKSGASPDLASPSQPDQLSLASIASPVQQASPASTP